MVFGFKMLISLIVLLWYYLICGGLFLFCAFLVCR